MSILISCLEHKDSTGKFRIDYSGIFPEGICSIDTALNSKNWVSHNQPFACLFHDEEQSITVLVRDHLGIEPLYYYYDNHTLIVAQTIGEILQHLPHQPNYNYSVKKKMRAGWMEYTDDTLYQNIKRVEPGHIMQFKSNNCVVKKPFWTLSKEGPYLQYKDDRDYLAHFASLMDEALLNAVGDHAGHCASEFSAGLDSSAIYCAAHDLGISPTLFMHALQPDINRKQKYNDNYEHEFIEHYQISKIHRVSSESFNPIEVLKEYANWFGGPAPHLFYMFAEPIHRAVAAGKYPILLSGFGGDQCVSSHVFSNFYIPQLIREHDFQRAWHELCGNQKPKSPMEFVKLLLRFATMAHSWPYAASIFYKRQQQRWGKGGGVSPYSYQRYRSLREAECSLVQGIGGNGIRMRIEYSSIVAKKMGFSYRYPLLYPKLLEFMLSVPLEQKRANGQGRYLMYRYLEYKLGNSLFQNYKKREGLPIFFNTLNTFNQVYEKGGFDSYFKDLPKPRKSKEKNTSNLVNQQVQELMLRFFEDSNPFDKNYNL